jgi:hypothetical protein
MRQRPLPIPAGRTGRADLRHPPPRDWVQRAEKRDYANALSMSEAAEWPA